MGTSKSFGGAGGSNPLLPPWAPPLDDDGDAPTGGGDGNGNGDAPPGPTPPPDLTQAPGWRGVKTRATRLAKSSASGAAARRRARDLTRSYVGTRGGARRAAQGSVAARSTARGFGGFLADVARNGVVQAFQRANLGRFLGGSAEDLLSGFAEGFLPAPNTLDDAAAREAGLEAFYDLLEQYNVSEEGIEALNALDADGIRHAIEHFISRYICASVLVALSQRIENGSVSADRCVEVENVIRSVIIETIRLDFREADVVNMDWNGPEARRMVDRLIQDAYGFLEGA